MIEIALLVCFLAICMFVALFFEVKNGDSLFFQLKQEGSGEEVTTDRNNLACLRSS